MPKQSKVPRASVFMKKKRKDEFGEKPWDYLKREMQEKADTGIKPYNKKVGDWLVYLRDLKIHYRNERQEQARILHKAQGPCWFIQFSAQNLKVMDNLKFVLHSDAVEHTVERTLWSLRRLGISSRFTEESIAAGIKQSGEEPGAFLWLLFTMYYKKPPSETLPKYNTNAKLLMSAIVFADLDECIKELDNLAKFQARPEKPAPPKRERKITPYIRYGEYLSPQQLPPCKTPPKKKPKPRVVDYRLTILEDEKFEALAKQSPEISLNLRLLDRTTPHKKECKYRFWEPPLSLRIQDPAEIEYIKMLRMFKNKPKHPPLANYNNIQCHIGTVTYSGNQPQYHLHNYTGIPTGYIIQNGGQVRRPQDYATNILGYVKYPRDQVDACVSTCHCLENWPAVMKHIVNSKCRCGHRYDFYNKSDKKPKTKYFIPPAKYKPYDLDIAKICEADTISNNIPKLFNAALQSDTESATASVTADINSVSPKVVVKSLLADLMKSHLLIPHLPKSYLLPNLQAWVRKRIKGPIGPKLNRRLLLQSGRRWLNIRRMDFRARAHRIPFSLQDMPKYDVSHRKLLQDIREREFKKLVHRTKLLQLRQTNMLWPTMRYDDFPDKNFLHAFSAYTTQPEKPVHIYNPLNPQLYARLGKTCRLRR